MTASPSSSRAGVAEGTCADPVGEPIGDRAGECFGRRIHALERGLVVEVAVGEFGHHRAQHLGCSTDVDHDVVGVEGGAPERGVDDVSRAMQALGGTEHLAAEAVGDHHVIADSHAEHCGLPS